MKTLKLTLFLISSFLVFDLAGQSKKIFLDTVNIDCDNGIELKIATYNHMNLKNDSTLITYIYSLQKVMDKLKNNVPDAFYKIIFNPDSSVIMEKIPPVRKYIIKGDSIVPFRQKNICVMKTARSDLYIFFDSIQALLDPAIAQCVTQTVQKLPGRNRYAQVYSYKYFPFVGSVESQPTRKVSGWDMLNITPGIGAGLVSESPVIDVSMEIGFNFIKKGVLKNSFYLSDDFLFVFGGYDFQSTVNDYVNIGYRYNLSNLPDKNNWLGIETGIPLMKGSHPLSDNLLRIGIKGDIGKSFWITGYLYINKYNSVEPGIKIGYGF